MDQSAERLGMQIHLFIDVGSPYSWCALAALLRYEALWGMQLRIRPVSAGALFKATGNSSPAAGPPAKVAYSMRDLRRNAAFFGVAFTGLPANFIGRPAAQQVPFNTLLALRLLVAAQIQLGDCNPAVPALAQALFTVVFGAPGGSAVVNLRDPQLLRSCCTRAGLSEEQAVQLLAAAGSEAVKARLQANARDALAAGAFGVPSMLVTFEAGRTGQQQQEQHGKQEQQGQQGREQQQVLVFGSDRLEQLAFIAGKPWLGPQPQQQHLGSASRL